MSCTRPDSLFFPGILPTCPLLVLKPTAPHASRRPHTLRGSNRRD
ncbi:hypothetical protein VDGL01_04558 [Verticillium dahliae]